MLSDGRPNDIKVGKGQVNDLTEAYRGRVAIADTAREVRFARTVRHYGTGRFHWQGTGSDG